MTENASKITSAIAREASEAPLPEFPYDAFPPTAREILKNFVRYCNCKPDYIAAAMLATAATTAGNSCHLLANNTFKAHPSLFFCLVGEPSQGKSHPLKFGLEPLLEMDSCRLELFKRAMAEYEATQECRRPKKEDDGTATETPRRPALVKTVYNDFTPESVWAGHTRNRRGIILYTDEFMGLFSMATRYGGSPFIQQLMSAWSMTPISITRKGSDVPEHIEEPHVNVAGTTQPDRLAQLLAGPYAKDGCLDRFIFVAPEDRSPLLLQPSTPETFKMAEETFIAWAGFVAQFTSYNYNDDDTKVIPLSPEAAERFTAWHNEVAIQSTAPETPALLRARLGKRPQHAMRLALVLELMETSPRRRRPEAVTLRSLEGAIALIERFDRGFLLMADEITERRRQEEHEKCLEEDPRQIRQDRWLSMLDEEFTRGDADAAADLLGIPTATVSRWLRKMVTDGDAIKVAHGRYSLIA